MLRVQRVLLGSVGALALTGLLASAAAAADLGRRAPVPVQAPIYAPAFSWTGFYLGLSLGGRWGDIDATSVSVGGGPPIANTTSNYDSGTFRVGGYVGYNWQVAPAWLIGVEADLAWGDGSASTAFVPGFTALAGDGFTVKHGADGSVRGRLGMLMAPTWMLYVTGGVTWQNLEATATLSGVGTQTNDDTRVGWTLGAGIEGSLWGNWLARAEYRFAAYDTWRTTFFPATSNGVIDISADTHTASVGLAYKF
jgi:outer membrane immunogenic protein